MKKLLTLLLMGFAMHGFSQTASDYCTGGRYNTLSFLNTTPHLGVTYGQANRLSGTPQTLLMDIYEPQGDGALARPVVILAHGGSFTSGDRSNLTSTCEYYARMGYVAATISYRLIDALIFDSTDYYEGALLAINDMRAAVRFFKEDAANANTYKIDTNFVFVGGVSAGAVMAAHVNFLDQDDNVPSFIQTIVDNNGGFEGNSSTNTQHSSSTAGALLYSGGLIRDEWVDSDDGATYIVHEENDPVVPYLYGTSSAAPFPVYLYGGGAIKNKCISEGVTYNERLYAGSSGHVNYFSSDWSIIGQESCDLMRGIICGTIGIEESNSGLGNVTLYPNPAHNTIRINNYHPEMEVKVIGTDGREAFIEINQDGTLAINRLSNGIYTIIITSDETQIQLKFTKN